MNGVKTRVVAIAAAMAGVLRLGGMTGPDDCHDVLVIGGTLEGVEAAVRERNSGGSVPKRVQLLTPFPYLGEDLAGTLELGHGGEPPKDGVLRRLWENETDHAAFDYWETPECRHPQYVFRNDRYNRLSEPRAPNNTGDAVWHDTDVEVRCLMADPGREVARAEVLVLEGRHGLGGTGATAGVTGEFLDGPRKGERIEFTRTPANLDLGRDAGGRQMSPFSYVAEIGSRVGTFRVTVRKSPDTECQYLSRVWFHLAAAAKTLRTPTPLKVKRTLDRVLIESGVDFMTSTAVEDVIRGPDGRIVGVKATNRSGTRVYRTAKVVDATRHCLLEGFGGDLPVGATETFSRIVVTDGTPPAAPGMKVEELPATYPMIRHGLTGHVFRCTFDLPMADGSFASFAAAEMRARELTWSRGMLDDADLLVWHRRPGAARPAARAAAEPAYDVVVVGGGTSGSPAAIAAARAGAKVLVVEYLGVLGGVGTDGMILGYYDGNHCGFTEEFKAFNRSVDYRGKGGYYPRAETWRRLCRDEGVTVWLGAMGIGVVREGRRVTGVRVGTEHGPVTVRAKCVIDATGNADIAAAAGAETEFLNQAEFALQSAGQAPQRLSGQGVNSDFGYVDDSNAADLWLFMVRARAGAPDAWDLAKMPDSRERRRVVPDYMLGAADVAANRTFPDTVVQARSRQDAHGCIADVFGFIAEDSVKELKRLSGRPRAQFDVNVPLRSLLPKGLDGIAVIGIASGVERDVQPIIRMQADLMNMGYSVGTAAAMAAKAGGDFRRVDLGRLREALVGKGILRPEALGWVADEDVSSDAAVSAAVKSAADGYRGSHVLWRKENRARALPLLREAYAAAKTDKERQIYAQILGFLGDGTGADTLVEIVEGRRGIVKTRTGRNYGESRHGGDNPQGFVLALGYSRSPKALGPLLARLGDVTPQTPMDAFRPVVNALAAHGGREAAPLLAEKLRLDGFHGFAVSDWRTLGPQGGYGGCPEFARCTRELALARALFACGDCEGLGRRTLEGYARDPRGALAAYAKAVLGADAARAEPAPFPAWSEPRAVTSGPHEHFLASYFAIDSWSPDKRYMLVLETDLNGRLPAANERCTLGVVDLEDGNRFIPVTTTACWNFQEAAMAFWMDNDTILFNDVRDGKFKTVIMNWRTGRDVRVLPRPVSAVSEDRTWAVSVNYARLSLLRPDYGYAGPGQDPQETVEWPENDGLWTMDLRTGESKLILSVAATRSQQPQPKRIAGKPGQPLAYHCHTVISKDGEKIFFLARSVDWFDKVTHEIPYWNTTSFTVNRDGTDLRRCFRDGWAGSHFNWAPDGSHRMLVTATWNDRHDDKATGRAWSTVEFEVGRESEVRRIGAGILDQDWHCVYSPDGKFMSGETYWNRYNERPWVLVRLEDGMTVPMGSFYVPEKYRGTYWRCDLHARYRPDGRQIAFNSVHEGSRQVYVRDITPAEGRGKGNAR